MSDDGKGVIIIRNKKTGELFERSANGAMRPLGMTADEYKGKEAAARSEKPAAPISGIDFGAPTLLDADLDVSARAFAQGEISEQDLFKNTVATLRQNYDAVMPSQVKGGEQIIHASDQKSGKRQSVSVSGQLSELYKRAQILSSKEATEQPEGATATQRALMGFKSPKGQIGFLRSQYPDATILPAVDSAGKITGGFTIRQPGKPAQFVDDPNKITLGDLADMVGDSPEAILGTIGAVQGAAVGSLAGGAGAVPGAAVGGAVGSAGGEAVRQAAGSFIPGDDELSARERMAQIGMSAAMGAVGEVGGTIAAPVIRGAARSIPRAAQRVYGALPESVPGVVSARQAVATREVGEPIAMAAKEAAEGTPLGTRAAARLEKGREAEETVRRLSKSDDFGMTPAELSGSREAKALERKMAQSPGEIDEMAAAKSARLEFVGKALDATVGNIAKNPENLSKGYMGEALASNVKRYAKELVSLRSKRGGEIYKEMERVSGGARNIPTDNVRDALGEISRAGLFRKDLKLGAREIMSKLDDISTKETGRINIADMQSLRTAFADMARGDESLFKGLSMANKKRLARKALDAIDADLDLAAASIKGREADLLRQANKAWAQDSIPLNELETATIKKVLKLDKAGSPENIIPAIGKLGPLEMRNTFKILDKIDPALASDTRAALLANIYEKGGKKVSASDLSRGIEEAMIGDAIKPGRLAASIRKNADLIDVIIGGNKQHRKDIIGITTALDRVAAGPGWGDSGTAANAVTQISSWIKNTSLSARVLDAADKIVSSRIMDKRQLLKAVSTPEGAANVKVFIDYALKRNPTWFTKERTERFLGAVNRLALEAGIDNEQTPQVDIQSEGG